MSKKKFAALFRILTIALILGSMLLQRSGVISVVMQNMITGICLSTLGVLMVIENRTSRKSNAKMDVVIGLVLTAMGLYLMVQMAMIMSLM